MRHNWQLTNKHHKVSNVRYPIFYCDQCECEMSVGKFWDGGGDEWYWYGWVHSIYYDEVPTECDPIEVARYIDAAKSMSRFHPISVGGYLYDDDDYNEVLQNLCDIVDDHWYVLLE